MKYLLCVLTALCFTISLTGQHVGIGTTQPSELLHIKDGLVRLEGDNKYFDLYTGSNAGIRFYAANSFKGAWFFGAASNQLNLTRSIFDQGFVFDFNQNKAFLGRNYAITTAETFGINTSVTSAQYGGMYLSTSGHSGAKPFYGYAVDSVGTAWHYFDGADNRWKLYVGGDRISVENTGDVGIGVIDPLNRLHVSGTVRIDHPGTPQLRFHQGLAFAGFIQSSGDEFTVSNKLAGPLTLRTNDVARISIANNGNVAIDQSTVFVDATANKVGINQVSPQEALHITGGDIRMDGTANPTLRMYQGSTLAAFIQSNSFIDELSISNKLTGPLNLRTNDFVRLSIANNGNVGIDYSTLYVDAVGNKVGMGEISPEDKLHLTGGNIRIENTTAQLSFYQGTNFGAFIQSGSGNLLISNKNDGELQLRTNDVRRLAITDAGDVVIGTIDPATGYRLSVDGKIIAEELKVQMSGLWPDYVFADQYPLRPIYDVKHFIDTHQHLPGIPSATEISAQQGVELGEMNRLLLEKVEELTLYVIDLQEQIDALRSK